MSKKAPRQGGNSKMALARLAVICGLMGLAGCGMQGQAIDFDASDDAYCKRAVLADGGGPCTYQQCREQVTRSRSR